MKSIIISKLRQRERGIALMRAKERFAGLMLEINNELPIIDNSPGSNMSEKSIQDIASKLGDEVEI